MEKVLADCSRGRNARLHLLSLCPVGRDPARYPGSTPGTCDPAQGSAKKTLNLYHDFYQAVCNLVRRLFLFKECLCAKDDPVQINQKKSNDSLFKKGANHGKAIQQNDLRW